MRHLVEKGHAKEAVSYVQRCDGPKRIDLYVECGEWVMAGKECKDRGNRAKLEYASSPFFFLIMSLARTLLTPALQEIAYLMPQHFNCPRVRPDRINYEMNYV